MFFRIPQIRRAFTFTLYRWRLARQTSAAAWLRPSGHYHLYAVLNLDGRSLNALLTRACRHSLLGPGVCRTLSIYHGPMHTRSLLKRSLEGTNARSRRIAVRLIRSRSKSARMACVSALHDEQAAMCAQLQNTSNALSGRAAVVPTLMQST
ncbi:hypothetical protein DFH06DRAFT_1156886 [Mycena polygramma]|nr:hypothetical protein DFH06DRAFT_1156886 [Mycena polygramma]